MSITLSSFLSILPSDTSTKDPSSTPIRSMRVDGLMGRKMGGQIDRQVGGWMLGLWMLLFIGMFRPAGGGELFFWQITTPMSHGSNYCVSQHSKSTVDLGVDFTSSCVFPWIVPQCCGVISTNGLSPTVKTCSLVLLSSHGNLAQQT